jgi:RNA polymerase sigma-70 factor (sigma-E family)
LVVEGSASVSKATDADFDEYFVARRRRLRRVAYLIVGDWGVAEETVQTAFANVFLAWSRINPETRDAYVRRAVVNTAISVARKRGREVSVPVVPDRALPDAEPWSELLDALRSLPPAQRAVIALRFLDDLSVTEAAHALRVSEGTIKSQTSRGLAVLRLHALQGNEGDLS